MGADAGRERSGKPQKNRSDEKRDHERKRDRKKARDKQRKRDRKPARWAGRLVRPDTSAATVPGSARGATPGATRGPIPVATPPALPAAAQIVPPGGAPIGGTGLAPGSAAPDGAQPGTPGAAPDPGRGRPTEVAPDPNAIGIVFIHGMGRHKPGETLIAWSRPLLRLITAWATTTHGVKPGNDPTRGANVDFSGTTRPFVVAAVPAIGGHPAQTWVMTEAWWASRVSPPPVGAVFRWLIPGEMIRLWRGIVSGIAGEGSVFFKLVDVVFLPLLLLPATALVILAYVLFRLLRIIPWKPIQELSALTAIQLFLVEWFGDVRVLLTDRVQAANIRARVADAISDCRAAGCGTIVLVGHSGGAIVGYMTLADETYASLPVNEFITHGQALGIAWRLGHADEYDVPDRNPDRLYRGDRLRETWPSCRSGRTCAGTTSGRPTTRSRPAGWRPARGSRPRSW